MNFLKTLCVFGSLSLFAYSNPAFTGILDFGDFRTGITSYPPGCVESIYYIDFFLSFNDSNSESIHAGTIPLEAWTANGRETVDIEVEILRVGCAEKDRSVILVQLHYPVEGDSGDGIVRVPFIEAGDYPLALALNREPHTLPSYDEYLEEGDRQVYFLQNGLTWVPIFSSFYNGAFELQFLDSYHGKVGPVIQIPAYENQLQASELALTGRLSGIWVVPEARDQGFLISVSEILSSHSRPLVIFLSWNTFDSDGNPLWLSGASTFSEFDSDVEIELILVENGEFLGTKEASRSAVGSIRLYVVSCTEIKAQYALETIGLGTGEIKLTRLFDLETAGFTCQDTEARSHFD